MFSVAGSGRKRTGSSSTESTGLERTRPASYYPRRSEAGNCWAWKPCGNSTFSRTPTAPSMENEPEVRSHIVTSSGSNQSTGALRNLRNSALDARNFFDQTTGAPRSSETNLEGLWEARSRRTRCSCSEPMKGFRSGYRVRALRLCRRLRPQKVLCRRFTGSRSEARDAQVRPTPSGRRLALQTVRRNRNRLLESAADDRGKFFGLAPL